MNQIELNDDQDMVFLIKPIKGCLTHTDNFNFTAPINEVEDEGLPALLINAGHWEFMSHPCYHFTVLKRTLITE